MLSLYLIWSEIGRKVVLDGGVDVGFLPAAMAAGVLQARAPEEGGEVVEELLRVGVVLLVLVARVRGLCNSGATARLNGQRNSSSSALRSGCSGGGNGNRLA
jgi:hypothetical protein